MALLRVFLSLFIRTCKMFLFILPSVSRKEEEKNTEINRMRKSSNNDKKCKYGSNNY